MTAVDIVLETRATRHSGLGHVMRAHFLARALTRRGVAVAIAPEGVVAADTLKVLGDRLVTADTPAAVVVRDVPDGSTEATIRTRREAGVAVVLVDDDGPAADHASLVINALGPVGWDRPVRRISGLDYAVINPSAARFHASPAPGTGRLCICFGGSDADNHAEAMVLALDAAGFSGPATVLVDPGVRSHHCRLVVSRWTDSQVVLLGGDIMPHLVTADLVITKIGLLQLETFCVGRPVVTVEPTQAHVALQARLAADYPGWPAECLGLAASCNWTAAARRTLAILRQKPSSWCAPSSLVDGRGADRVVDQVIALWMATRSTLVT